MIATLVPDRNGKLGEYLELLRSMGLELERSMRAIGANSLPQLEESISNQQILAARLSELADDLSKPAQPLSVSAALPDDENLMRQIRGAADTLQKLNQRYSALLKLSSHSIGLMISLFRSFSGQMQEGAGTRLKRQTWSCQA